MKKEVLIATTNTGKCKEIKDLLEKHGIATVSPMDLAIDIDVAETGSTLEENASLKALAYQRLAPDRLVIADDTGLEITALNNEPGIYVRRWKDKRTHMSDEEILDYCVERMRDIPNDKRQAKFRTVVALAVPQSDVEFFEGTVEGDILETPESFRVKGLPFDSIFHVTGLNLILGEAKKLDQNEPKNLTHRNKAVIRSATRIKELLGI